MKEHLAPLNALSHNVFKIEDALCPCSRMERTRTIRLLTISAGHHIVRDKVMKD